MKTVYALLVALMLSLSPNAAASVATAVSFDQKVLRADSIVLGRCTRQHSAYDPSGRWILTYTTFEVSKSYKGFASPEITVVTPGGQVGTLHQETVGVPRFGVGDINLLFITSGKSGQTILYFDQGTYEVSETSGQEIVAPVESDLVLIDSQTGIASSPAAEGTRSLKDFESRVLNVLKTAPTLRKETSR